ncbi:MAG: PP2C family protein-serine/threonine phosphatase [Planctomycetota bacterium]
MVWQADPREDAEQPLVPAAQLFVERDMEGPEAFALGGGTCLVLTRKRADREGPNEDAALLVELDQESAVLAVADGAGGTAAGAQASRLALTSMVDALKEANSTELSVREAILRGFDRANTAVNEMGVGAATTLCVAEIYRGTIRTYHVGDSLILVTGQRGKRKLQTIAHSPVGYAVEAGVLDEKDAMHHEERHIVSNMVGSSEMRVDMSAPITLALRDTVLLASDGLTDNLHLDELVELVRKGRIDKAAHKISEKTRKRMDAPTETQPSKPDDLTFVLYRTNPAPRAPREASGT